MAAYLVTGNPGSGKSSVGRELARRGFEAIDPDEDAELAHWVDSRGSRVTGPEQPNGEWLASHRWVWERERLHERLAASDQDVFVCGIARNQAEFVDLFDAVFLLRIDAETQDERLVAYDAQGRPRSEAGRAEIRDGRSHFENEMMAIGAVGLDGTSTITQVTNQLLAAVARR